MSDIALRPRSSTELVDAAFQLYRRDPVPFITAFAMIYVPWLIIGAVTGLGDMPENPAGATGKIAIAGLVGGIIYMLSLCVATCLARDAYFDRPLDLRSAYRETFRRFGDVFVAGIVAGLATMVGFICLIIPAIYVYCRLFAIRQAVLLEERSGTAAIKRSWSLVQGNVLHAFLTLALSIFLIIAVAFGAGIVGRMLPTSVLRQMVGTIVACVVYPIVGIIETILYYDIRIRREGFDIEYLAAMAPSTPATPQSAPT
ncbi:MAG TPA: hypothetical protein VGM82_03925 [Gemmatimonadaceae bacterium]|jgi:hypothetical protein